MADYYTMRRTWPDDPGRPDDYVFRCGRVDAGRCYLRAMSNNQSQWYWTIYVGVYVRRSVLGVPISGYAETLEQAKAAFRGSFDKLFEAGAANLDRSETSAR